MKKRRDYDHNWDSTSSGTYIKKYDKIVQIHFGSLHRLARNTNKMMKKKENKMIECLDEEKGIQSEFLHN